MVAGPCGYLGDDRRAVVLGPDRRGGTLVNSGAASVAPAAFCHPRRQQTGSTGGQLITARANQWNLSDLGRRQISYSNDFIATKCCRRLTASLEEHCSLCFIGLVVLLLICFQLKCLCNAHLEKCMLARSSQTFSFFSQHLTKKKGPEVHSCPLSLCLQAHLVSCGHEQGSS